MNAKELIEYCAASIPNLGIVGETLFFSFMPDSPDACITVYDTGGWQPSPYLPRKDPTFQFRFRAADYDAAQSLIKRIADYFVPEGIPKNCFPIGSEFIQLAQPMQAAPFCLGYDQNNQIVFTWNFTFIIH